MIVYRCQDSLENIFTAVYRAYEEKRNLQDTVVSLTEEPVLFAEDIFVETDWEKGNKVSRSLRRMFGEQDYYMLCMALTAPDEKKAQAVYRTIVDGITFKRRPGHLFDNMAEEQVHLAFSFARGASRELQHLEGFVRFQELENGTLCAKITPKNHILVFLMEHFSDRLPKENFMIYDAGRKMFGVHPSGKAWYLMQDEELSDAMAGGMERLSEQEKQYQELFRYFCHKIAIKERENLDLQKNMLPLRFRENMTEFAGCKKT